MSRAGQSARDRGLAYGTKLPRPLCHARCSARPRGVPPMEHSEKNVAPQQFAID